MFFWLEELIPNYRLDLSQVKNINDDMIKVLVNSLLEWKVQKLKRDRHEISYEAIRYILWRWLLYPEKVPVWFKECSLVLIDRDRIYTKDKRSGY